MQFAKIQEWKGSFGFASVEGSTSYRRLYIHKADQMAWDGRTLRKPDETYKPFKHIRPGTRIAVEDVIPSPNNPHTNRALKWAAVVKPSVDTNARSFDRKK